MSNSKYKATGVNLKHDPISFINKIFLIAGTIFIFGCITLFVIHIRNTSVSLPSNPKRTIIVDKNLTIIRIVSNTTKDIVPSVRLEKETGIEIPLTEVILDRYNTLKPFLNFSQKGIVYERDKQGQFIIDTITGILKKLIKNK